MNAPYAARREWCKYICRRSTAGKTKRTGVLRLAPFSRLVLRPRRWAVPFLAPWSHPQGCRNVINPSAGGAGGPTAALIAVTPHLTARMSSAACLHDFYSQKAPANMAFSEASTFLPLPPSFSAIYVFFRAPICSGGP